MDLTHGMRVFVRVIDSGSFTAAANALDLSTAQVSRVVSDLESHLQARLLHRSTRRLRLTETGEQFLQHSRQILAEMDEAVSAARGSHLLPRGRLRVHCMMGLGVMLAPLVARYGELYPDVAFELTLSQQMPDLLQEAQDVVITIASELPDSQLVAQPIGRMFSVLCAAPSYLQQQGVPQVPDDLLRHRCLHLIDPLYSQEWVLRDEQQEYHLLPEKVFHANVAEALARAAEAGMGICQLPFFSGTDYFRDGRLLRVLPKYKGRESSIYALYPSRHYLDAKVKTWVEFLRKELPGALQSHQCVAANPDYWAS